MHSTYTADTDLIRSKGQSKYMFISKLNIITVK
jgi:hypothetical protein